MMPERVKDIRQSWRWLTQEAGKSVDDKRLALRSLPDLLYAMVR